MAHGHLPKGVHDKITAWTKLQVARDTARLDHIHESAYRSFGKQPTWSQMESNFDIQADRGEMGLKPYQSAAAPTEPVRLAPGGAAPQPVRPERPKLNRVPE